MGGADRVGAGMQRGDSGLGGGAYHPDRSFDTLACAGGGPLEVLAALEKGVRCALVEPDLGARLVGPAASTLPDGVAVGRTLSFDDRGRIEVPRLRTWLAGCSGASLRVVANGAVGPYLCRPLQQGADVVIEDLGTLLDPTLLPEGFGGPCVAVVARSDRAWGEFWGLLGRQEPEPVLTEGDEARLGSGLRCLSSLSQRRSDAALAVAHYLAAHPAVTWVSYPGLPGDEANESARATFEHGFGPLVAFGVAGGAELCEGGVVGDGKTVVRSRLLPGTQPGAWVFSAGLENALDVVAALDRIIAEGLALGSNGR